MWSNTWEEILNAFQLACKPNLSSHKNQSYFGWFHHEKSAAENRLESFVDKNNGCKDKATESIDKEGKYNKDYKSAKDNE